MDNLDQSELSHIYWLDYVSEFEERWGRTPDESHRMTWKAAFRSGASAVRNNKTAPELFATLRTADTIKTENIEVVWAEDTKPGVQRVNFPLRVDPDVLEWFGDRAVEVGKDRSVLARIALNEYIERNS